MSKTFFSHRNKCPACHSKDFRRVYQKPFDAPPVSQYLESFYADQGGVDFNYLTNASFHLCECAACKLIFQLEVPNDFLMSVLYEQWMNPEKIFLQHRLTDGLGLFSNYAHEISMMIDYFDEVPSSLSFFDFGMGWGKWALMAKAFGCNSFGTELSADRVTYAASNGINVISWEDIPRHKFDFINTEQVFEHISDPLHTLQHLKTALKPGGILKVSVPTAHDIAKRLKIMDWGAPKGTKNSLNAVAPLEHINFFRRESLTKMAAVAGMEQVFIPMRIQYRNAGNWKGIKRTARNLLLPIYRNVLRRQNCLFFQNKQSTSK